MAAAEDAPPAVEGGDAASPAEEPSVPATRPPAVAAAATSPYADLPPPGELPPEEAPAREMSVKPHPLARPPTPPPVVITPALRPWAFVLFAILYLYAFPYFGALRSANELPRVLTTQEIV